jgi:hypothetical protein
LDEECEPSEKKICTKKFIGQMVITYVSYFHPEFMIWSYFDGEGKRVLVWMRENSDVTRRSEVGTLPLVLKMIFFYFTKQIIRASLRFLEIVPKKFWAKTREGTKVFKNYFDLPYVFRSDKSEKFFIEIFEESKKD